MDGPALAGTGMLEFPGVYTGNAWPPGAESGVCAMEYLDASRALAGLAERGNVDRDR